MVASWTPLTPGGVSGDLPPPDTRIGQRIGYHFRTGAHDILVADWAHPLDFADQFLLPPAAPAAHR